MTESPPSPTTLGNIRAEELTKVYGKRSVVDGVNLRMDAGEVVGLLGPNGAGKTTSFYMIVGLIEATAGRVFLDQREVTRLPMYTRARRGIGYLPQEPSVFRKLTVEQNLLAVAELLPLNRRERRELVDRRMEEMGLTHVSKQKAYTLSGGERRRVEISRALVSEPRFLLMDEPFSGVDPKSVQEVQDIILRLKSQGIGILITDHNVRETLSIVDRAYLMHDGKVLSEGTSQDLLNDPQSRQFYLGDRFNL